MKHYFCLKNNIRIAIISKKVSKIISKIISKIKPTDFEQTGRLFVLYCEFFDKLFIKANALSDILEHNMFICAVNRGVLLLVQINRCKAENIVRNIGKTPCVRAGNEQKRCDDYIGKNIVYDAFKHFELLCFPICRLTVITLDFLNLHAVLCGNFLDFFKSLVEIVLSYTTQKHC